MSKSRVPTGPPRREHSPRPPSGIDRYRFCNVQDLEFGDKLESLRKASASLVKSPHEKLGERWRWNGEPFPQVRKLGSLSPGLRVCRLQSRCKMWKSRHFIACSERSVLQFGVDPRCANRSRSVELFVFFVDMSLHIPPKDEIGRRGRASRFTASLKLSSVRFWRLSKSYASLSSATVLVAIDLHCMYVVKLYHLIVAVGDQSGGGDSNRDLTREVWSNPLTTNTFQRFVQSPSHRLR